MVYQKISQPCHHKGLHYCVPERLLLVTMLHCHSSIVHNLKRPTAFSTTILRVGLLRFSVCNLHNAKINARHLPQSELHYACNRMPSQPLNASLSAVSEFSMYKDVSCWVIKGSGPTGGHQRALTLPL